MLHSFISYILKKYYRIQVQGLSNYTNSQGKLLLILNNPSCLAGILLTIFLSKKILLIIDAKIVKKLWLKPLLFLFRPLIIDVDNAAAILKLIKKLTTNSHALILPGLQVKDVEELRKTYNSLGLIIAHTKAAVMPVSASLDKQVKFIFAPATKIQIETLVVLRERRQLIAAKLYELLSSVNFANYALKQTLFTSLLKVKELRSKNIIAMEDLQAKPITYKKLIMNSLVLAKVMINFCKPGEVVGLLLPNANHTMLCFFALQSFGAIPAMLNYSTGANNINSACVTARIKVIYTSRKFIAQASLQSAITSLLALQVKIIYLEDLSQQIKWRHKLSAMLIAQSQRYCLQTQSKLDPNNAAVILFTSGSEGIAKGVALSHSNIQANRLQLSSRINFNSQDIVFNSMPLFHSFGLTAGTLLPLLAGIKVFFYPSPLHYRTIAKLLYTSKATILFGSDTFLSGYARCASAYYFDNLRYIFAGAEPLKPATRELWSDKFNGDIFEGYGVTEAAPVLAVNTPMQQRANTVGKFLPQIKYKLTAISGIKHAARLWVAGPNIMLGYLQQGNAGKIIAPEHGWHDTGDIVRIDSDGFISILGRAKRFAKIAGEMVSLLALENWLAQLWPEVMHAVISRKDPKKGEQLLLITEHKTAQLQDLFAYLRKINVAEIYYPKQIQIIESMPLLSTGKIDYLQLQQLYCPPE